MSLQTTAKAGTEDKVNGAAEQAAVNPSATTPAAQDYSNNNAAPNGTGVAAKPSDDASGWPQDYNMEGGIPDGVNVIRGRSKMLLRPEQLNYCEICQISCSASRDYRIHLEGKKHKKRQASLEIGATAQNPGQNYLQYCEVCKIYCPGSMSYQEHLKGRQHKKRASAQNPSENYHCELCDVNCGYAKGYTEHVKGAKHQKKIKLHPELGIPLPADEPKMMAGIDVVPTSGSAATLATIGNDPAADGETAREVDTEGGKIDDVENTDNVQPLEVAHIEELDFVAPPGQRHLAEGGDEQRRRSQNVDECEKSNSVAPNFEGIKDSGRLSFSEWLNLKKYGPPKSTGAKRSSTPETSQKKTGSMKKPRLAEPTSQSSNNRRHSGDGVVR